MLTIPQVAKTMQTVLTSVADAAARSSTFVQRSSKLTGALFVQTLTFGFLANPCASREQLAQTAAALGLHISPQALDKRLTFAAADCLQQVIEQATSTLLACDPAAPSVLARFNGVELQDSTAISLPDSLASLWLGSGNQNTADDPASRLKLSVRLNLRSGSLTGPFLDHGRTSDRSTLVQDLPIEPGSLRLADLGFFDLQVFHEIAQNQAYWLSRLQISTVISTLQGQRLELLKFLSSQNTAVVDAPILLGARQGLKCRLLAVRVPQEVADQRRRRLREEAKRRGRSPNVMQLALAEWTIFVTNAPPEKLEVKEALVLGRARWQIELLFKLWKSHGQIDEWRSKKGAAILCELYAKLLGQIVQHWVMLVGCWGYADRSLIKAAQTVRAHTICLATAIDREERLVEAIEMIASCLAKGCRINKRKTKPHTYQLLLDVSEAVLG